MAKDSPQKSQDIETMGRKPKRGARKKKGGRRNGEKQVAPAGCASSDGEGGSACAGLQMPNIECLMRQVIPKDVTISSRAKQLTHDCAVKLVGLVADEASEQARAQHRRTVKPEDIKSSL
ncbi:hypothetical protein BAE44_0023022 [Dichanthelium oligosanthes]|uniref:Transcription factor CBF/NF-Y/archaeal histone domain-containing protein n=1 Tax=Dichanthelium oligosanthes TaxID=888268 RepID=A0A1E5USS8_9POAL|nr:hypothetical protein BAE44_0023022 [Dichanthelium oligosanthes]